MKTSIQSGYNAHYLGFFTPGEPDLSQHVNKNNFYFNLCQSQANAMTRSCTKWYEGHVVGF